MGFWRVLYRCGRTIGHLTVGEFTVTGVPLFLFAFLVSSWEMDGKAERRWLGTSPCDNERTIALRKSARRAYEGTSSELTPPGPRSRVGTDTSIAPTVLTRVWCHLITNTIVFVNCWGQQNLNLTAVWQQHDSCAYIYYGACSTTVRGRY